MDDRFLPVEKRSHAAAGHVSGLLSGAQIVYGLTQNLRKQMEEEETKKKKAFLKEIPIPRTADMHLPAIKQRSNDCSTCSCQKHNEQLIQAPIKRYRSVPVQWGTLSDYDTRKWYLIQESKIPSLLDGSLPLVQQARQAFELRNAFRMDARGLMKDRVLAASLDEKDPNLTWEQVVAKNESRGLSGDDLYKAIIHSSQRSRQSVNEALGIRTGGADEHTSGETHQ